MRSRATSKPSATCRCRTSPPSRWRCTGRASAGTGTARTCGSRAGRWSRSPIRGSRASCASSKVRRIPGRCRSRSPTGRWSPRWSASRRAGAATTRQPARRLRRRLLHLEPRGSRRTRAGSGITDRRRRHASQFLRGRALRAHDGAAEGLPGAHLPDRRHRRSRANPWRSRAGGARASGSPAVRRARPRTCSCTAAPTSKASAPICRTARAASSSSTSRT